jgi:hypothetical protein
LRTKNEKHIWELKSAGNFCKPKKVPIALKKISALWQRFRFQYNFNGFTGNSLKADPGAHPPPTVIAGHPVQGEDRQGSHPPDQEDSATKSFWSWSSSSPGASERKENESKTYQTVKSVKTLTRLLQTPAPSSTLTWRKFDSEEEKIEEERRKKKMLYMKKEEEKRIFYLPGPESEASPAPPVSSSSSRSVRSACWSSSSTGRTQPSQTPECSSGRGEEGRGSQDNFKSNGKLSLISTLHARNCRTAAYVCTGNLLDGEDDCTAGRKTDWPMGE